jgi:hypothetical protein
MPGNSEEGAYQQARVLQQLARSRFLSIQRDLQSLRLGRNIHSSFAKFQRVCQNMDRGSRSEQPAGCGVIKRRRQVQPS